MILQKQQQRSVNAFYVYTLSEDLIFKKARLPPLSPLEKGKRGDRPPCPPSPASLLMSIRKLRIGKRDQAPNDVFFNVTFVFLYLSLTRRCLTVSVQIQVRNEKVN